MSVDLSQFLGVFYEESLEGLDVVESSLLSIDLDTVDPETINTIFRAAHSIKGGSATFGLTAISGFTHLLETLLDQIRAGERPFTQEIVELLLKSVDCLRDMIQSSRAGQPVDEVCVADLKRRCEVLLQVGPSAAPASEKKADAKQDNTSTVQWEVFFKPDVNVLRTGNEPLRIFRELSELGQVTAEVDTSRVPDFISLDPEECHLSWTLSILTGEQDQSKIQEPFEWVMDEAELRISRKDVEIANPAVVVAEEAACVGDTSVVTDVPDVSAAHDPSVAKKETATVKGIESASIRVGIEKVDALVNMVGELVITQSMLSQIGEDFDMSRLPKLMEGLAQLEQHTRELQENVMRIRMLPISFAFSRFPRLVRDLGRQLAKKVDLRLLGETTELDKTVLEKIGDPLTHLVRNAMDHGLEGPEERLARGKSETGTVTLNAYHQGGNIVIEISDDGRGLNYEKILDKARSRGLVGDADVLSREQIADLIFQPGFSTADVVSDVSGRGVGMDVVRRNIQELNGSIEIQSEPGKGSVFRIRLPLTLAILDGQLVRVGQELFIMPLVSIIESTQVDVDLVNHVAGGCEVFRLRDEYIPIVRLHEIFHIKPSSHDIKDCLLVVLETGDGKVGLVVDDLLAQQQVVIKSLETNYRRVEGVSGATILGDGTVSLILDIGGIVKLAGVEQVASELRKNRGIAA